MGKRLFFLGILCGLTIFARGAYPYDYGLLNMNTPSQIEKRDLEFRIRHRFYGVAYENPLDTFFGMSEGANVNLGLRYKAWSRIEFDGSYTFDFNEYTLGARFVPLYRNDYLYNQIELQYFNYEDSLGERKGNVYLELALQSAPILNIMIPALTVGYDFDFKHPSIGIGSLFRITEKLYLAGEYYPLISSGTNVSFGDKSAYALGVILHTWGHHFTFILGNSIEIGQRRISTGASDNKLRFGFNIQRLFSL
jgi:hypothetical protein